MLVTLGVPFEPAASEFAVDTAAEAGLPLLIVNVVEMILGPAGIVMGASWELLNDDEATTLAAPARIAASVGVRVERLRLCSPHPVDALLQLVGERDPGILVFGPDRSRVKPRRYRRVERAVRERVPCLVWTPAE